MKIHESRPDQVEQVFEHSAIGLANGRLPCDKCGEILDSKATTPQVTVHIEADPEPETGVLCPSETSIIGVYCTECDIRTLADSPLPLKDGEPAGDEYLLAARVVDGWLQNVRAVERHALEERPTPIAYNPENYDTQADFWSR